MKHELNKSPELTIVNEDVSFSQIYQKPYVPQDFIEEIKRANILLLPHENFREGYNYLFPEDTQEFFEYLQDSLSEQNVYADICISDDEFKTIELHADVINFAWMIVEFVVFPVLAGIIIKYLNDKMKKSNSDDINANIKITIEKNGKSKTIKYEGSAANFDEAMKSIDENIFK